MTTEALTDWDITLLCARAAGYDIFRQDKGRLRARQIGGRSKIYCPLFSDEQAMGLVKKFNVAILKMADGNWGVSIGLRPEIAARSHSLNRAIVECVAKMQAERATA
jgi:hypothetical protein